MEKKKEYRRPSAELYHIHSHLSLLVNFSSEAEIGDWEDGGDL